MGKQPSDSRTANQQGTYNEAATNIQRQSNPDIYLQILVGQFAKHLKHIDLRRFHWVVLPYAQQALLTRNPMQMFPIL